MFSTAKDHVPQTSGIVGNSGLIMARFVWPYGGRQVFLTGTFTRWSDHVLMSQVEGCPMVFQAVCPITPGYHQYKFFVDGEWRHDEQQPSVIGTYGTVNTVLLARESDPFPPNLNPDTHGSRSNMDVDNEAFRRVVTLSDGTLQETALRISDADVQNSRHRISLFLSSHTAYELLPESGKVIALDINLPVKQAFHILYEQGIAVAPLWDFYKGQFVGVLSALDFILILREIGNHGPNLTEEELETHTISAWKEGKMKLRQMDRSPGSFRKHLVHVDPHDTVMVSLTGCGITCSRHWLEQLLMIHDCYHLLTDNGQSVKNSNKHTQAGPYDSLKDVALKILQNEGSTVPIIHCSSPDGSFPQLLHLASLSGILKCICRHFRHSPSSLPVLQQPISALPLGTWVPKIGEPTRRPLATLRPNATLSSALALLVQDEFDGDVSAEGSTYLAPQKPISNCRAQVSSIPIVDDNYSLLDIYSRSDITALAKDLAYTQIHLDDMSIHQALQLGQDANPLYGFFNGQRCQMCLPSDPLHKVMERLASPGVRRLVIVEAGSKRVEGIVSLSDVFRFLLG